MSTVIQIASSSCVVGLLRRIMFFSTRRLRNQSHFHFRPTQQMILLSDNAVLCGITDALSKRRNYVQGLPYLEQLPDLLKRRCMLHIVPRVFQTALHIPFLADM